MSVQAHTHPHACTCTLVHTYMQAHTRTHSRLCLQGLGAAWPAPAVRVLRAHGLSLPITPGLCVSCSALGPEPRQAGSLNEMAPRFLGWFNKTQTDCGVQFRVANECPSAGKMTSRRQYRFQPHDSRPLSAIPSTHRAILFHNEAGGSRRARRRRCPRRARAQHADAETRNAWADDSDTRRGAPLGAERRRAARMEGVPWPACSVGLSSGPRLRGLQV